MILLAFVIGVYALHHGYKKHHQNKFPIILFSVGFLLLICKQIWHPLQLLFLIPAVLLIVSAHYINLKFYKKKMGSNKIPVKSYPG